MLHAVWWCVLSCRKKWWHNTHKGAAAFSQTFAAGQAAKRRRAITSHAKVYPIVAAQICCKLCVCCTAVRTSQAKCGSTKCGDGVDENFEGVSISIDRGCLLGLVALCIFYLLVLVEQPKWHGLWRPWTALSWVLVWSVWRLQER